MDTALVGMQKTAHQLLNTIFSLFAGNLVRRQESGPVCQIRLLALTLSLWRSYFQKTMHSGHRSAQKKKWKNEIHGLAFKVRTICCLLVLNS
jgi:hypothetical protein